GERLTLGTDDPATLLSAGGCAGDCHVDSSRPRLCGSIRSHLLDRLERSCARYQLFANRHAQQCRLPDRVITLNRINALYPTCQANSTSSNRSSLHTSSSPSGSRIARSGLSASTAPGSWVTSTMAPG